MKKRIVNICKVLCAAVLSASLVSVGSPVDTSGENEFSVADEPVTNSFAGMTLTVSFRNLTEFGVVFYGNVVLPENNSADSFGIVYTKDRNFKSHVSVLSIDALYSTSFAIKTYLQPETTYYYASYINEGSEYKYSPVMSFTTSGHSAPILCSVSQITEESALISGKVVPPLDESFPVEYGIEYSQFEDFSYGVTRKEITDIDYDNKFSVLVSYSNSTTIYYRSYIKMNGYQVYSASRSFKALNPYRIQTDLDVLSAINLSSSATANCYVVSNRGLYKFKTVKGNSLESVGNVASASILWETFGTSEAPEYFDLIKAVCYKDGYIAFQIANTFKEGNAVIAAKDEDGKILWSWHIWLTDQPKGQAYYRNAGTMMDRNLGATSATPGDVGALGLLYQWGRKDPFLGSSSISSSTVAKSTITWPSAVSTNSSRGTVSYVTAHPTTFVYASLSPYDWHYSSCDNSLWTTSAANKSIYDPCPAGWRVPDGGSHGVWSKALGSSYTEPSYDSTNEGINFSGKFGSASTIWYPASGWRGDNGSLGWVGDTGDYWSASPANRNAYTFYCFYDGSFNPSGNCSRAYGLSVRCIRD